MSIAASVSEALHLRGARRQTRPRSSPSRLSQMTARLMEAGVSSRSRSSKLLCMEQVVVHDSPEVRVMERKQEQNVETPGP